ncbi:MAG TPA: hypothetical protein VFZ25_02810 [Chloroflexota bacterium]|nr:hypothetical protein [Chloroflexota bacterium]
MVQPRPIVTRDPDTARELEEEARQLVQRLRQGEALIRDKRARGDNAEIVDHWENRWVQLLHRYEILSDRLYRLSLQPTEE